MAHVRLLRASVSEQRNRNRFSKPSTDHSSNMYNSSGRFLCTLRGRYDWIISAFRANMYLPKGKTKKKRRYRKMKQNTVWMVKALMAEKPGRLVWKDFKAFQSI